MNLRSSCAVVIATSSLVVIACKESQKERPLPPPLTDTVPQQTAAVDPAARPRPATVEERSGQDSVEEKAKTRPSHDGGSGVRPASVRTPAPEATATSTGAAQADPTATAAPRAAAPPTQEAPAPAAPAAPQPTE